MPTWIHTHTHTRRTRRSTRSTQGHWSSVCCTRRQTDMSECVWSLYRSSDARPVASDPRRSVRDVPKVRGHLSFLNTETVLSNISEPGLGSLQSNQSLFHSFFVSNIHSGCNPPTTPLLLSLENILRTYVLIEPPPPPLSLPTLYCFCAPVLFHHPFTRLQRQIAQFTRKSRRCLGKNFHSCLTSFVVKCIAHKKHYE